MRFFEIFFVPLQPKGCETARARQLMHCNATLCTFRSEKHHGPRLIADLSAEISHKYVFIMARPIKETPVLKGKDVERFKYNLEHPTPVSAEEVTKARETYEKFKRITTFVL